MASRTSTIRFNFEGNASDASRALRELAAEATKAGGITKAQMDKIGKAFGDAAEKAKPLSRTSLTTAARGQGNTGFENLIGRLPGGNVAGGLLEGLGGAEAVLGQIGTKAAVATAGVAALGVAAAVAGKASFAAFQSVGTSIGKFQQTLGGTTEDASRFWYVMSAAGVNPEQGLDALNQFAVNVTQNKDDLDEFGVSVARFRDGTTDMVGTLYNVIDAYQGMGDSAERARLLSVTLGEEGMRQLQPLLRRNTDELKAMSASAKGVLNEGDLQRLDDWKATWGQLSATIGLAGAQIGSAMAPALTTLVDGAAEAVDVGTTLGGVLVDASGVVFSPVVDGVRALGDALEAAERKGRGLAGAIGDVIGSGTIDEALGGVGRASADAANAVGEDWGSAGRSLQAASNAVAAMAPRISAAFNGVASARAGAADAARGVADAEVESARTIEDANRSAAASITSASDQVVSAKASWGDAAADLAKAEQQAARTVADAEKDAAKSILGAQERVAEAYEDHSRAVTDLADAERDAQRTIADANEDAAERIVDAQDRVADAHERAGRLRQDNARRIEDAELSANDAINRALASDNPYEAERIRGEALRDLERTREDVTESELDAVKDIAEAQAGLVDATIEAEQVKADAVERAAEIIGQAREQLVESSARVSEAETSLAETVQEAAQRRADAHASAAESISSAQNRVWQAAAAVSAAESNLANVTWQAEDARARAAESAANRIVAARQAELNAATALFNAQVAYHNSLTTLNQRVYQTPAVQAAPVTRPWEARASGGPVSAGQTYLIGEAGPELLHMGGNGAVQANGAWGGGVTVINNFNGAILEGQKLVEYLERQRRNGYGGSN